MLMGIFSKKAARQQHCQQRKP